MYSKFAGVWSQWSGFLREKTGIGFYSYLLDQGPLAHIPTALFLVHSRMGRGWCMPPGSSLPAAWKSPNEKAPGATGGLGSPRV